jgi:hypothetical protein
MHALGDVTGDDTAISAGSLALWEREPAEFADTPRLKEQVDFTAVLEASFPLQRHPATDVHWFHSADPLQ